MNITVVAAFIEFIGSELPSVEDDVDVWCYATVSCTPETTTTVIPRTSRKIGDRAFSVAAPHAWNRLLTDLKLLRSTASFKSKLKSYLFDAAYTGNTV